MRDVNRSHRVVVINLGEGAETRKTDRCDWERGLYDREEVHFAMLLCVCVCLFGHGQRYMFKTRQQLYHSYVQPSYQSADQGVADLLSNPLWKKLCHTQVQHMDYFLKLSTFAAQQHGLVLCNNGVVRFVNQVGA